jgi:hypothetical protein
LDAFPWLDHADTLPTPLAFNLINEVDVAETEAKMARYEKENKDSIAANEARSVCLKGSFCTFD